MRMTTQNHHKEEAEVQAEFWFSSEMRSGINEITDIVQVFVSMYR